MAAPAGPDAPGAARATLCALGALAVTGLGPLGIAFFLWDRALKTGDPRTIGVLSYLTPLASTVLLMAVTGRGFTP